jgi:hypothetical protein
MCSRSFIEDRTCILIRSTVKFTLGPDPESRVFAVSAAQPEIRPTHGLQNSVGVQHLTSATVRQTMLTNNVSNNFGNRIASIFYLLQLNVLHLI